MERTLRRSGFGLIEMAIIMVIVGMVIATIMPRILGKVGTDKAKQAKFNLQAVRDEIIGYAAVNGNLPAAVVGAGGYTVVPKALVSHHLDVWDQEIGYIVAQDAGGDLLSAINVNSAVAPTQLTVALYDHDGGSQLKTTSDVGFIVYSIGANHIKDVDDTGVAGGVGNFIHYPFAADIDTLTTTPDANDDIIEYVVLDYLKTKAAASAGTPVDDGSPHVSFDSNIATNFTTGTASDPVGTGNISVDTPTATISLSTGGGASSPGKGGCIWYMGDTAANAGNCSSGVCDLGSGLRAYFKYSTTKQILDGGFTFAIPSVSTGVNDVSSSLCGNDTVGRYLSYAGSKNSDTVKIAPPKIAVEFDYYRDSDRFDVGDGTQERYDNHVSAMFWGATGDYNDDNAHGVPSSSTATAAKNPYDSITSGTSDGDDGVYDAGPDTWLETLMYDNDPTPEFRMELVRTPGTGAITVRVWYNCSSYGDCDDLSNDLQTLNVSNPDPDIEYDIQSTDPSAAKFLSPSFDRHRMGWTFSSQNNNENIVNISAFALRWR